MWPFVSSLRVANPATDSRALPAARPEPLQCLLLAAALMLSSLSFDLQAAQVYRHVDANGNVVFSDQPAGGSKVQLTPLSVVPSTESLPPRRSTPSRVSSSSSSESTRTRAPAVDVAFRGYTTFTIQSPSNEETLQTGQAGNLAVRLGIEPKLRPEDKVRVTVDGAPSQSAMHSTVFMVPALERGKHVIQAELLDSTGRVRQTSEPKVVYVQRASVNLPRNPNNPANAGGG
ncbi:DUF4124 domain-containing protein [Cobetia amphilecti]|uniref:DUF4124 domain-containing protein n=1 Tax=Cobetia amphilecti TaxID=1055104 RepID=UPI001FCFF996|nr:DUF4124 domain-containing protein [Cobetia amphilecti]